MQEGSEGWKQKFGGCLGYLDNLDDLMTKITKMKGCCVCLSYREKS